MSGTTSGWPTQPNLGTLAAVGQPAYVDPTTMTPAQLQAQRQRLYAQALLNQTSAAPQRSGWGALNQALTPMIGAYMMPRAQQPGGIGNMGTMGAGGPAPSNLPVTPGYNAPM